MEKKDKNDIVPEEKPQEQPADTQQPLEAKLPDDIVIDDEETVATAEDLANFMKDRRKAHQEKKNIERENPEVEEYHTEESQLDPYLEPDPDIPWVKYDEAVRWVSSIRKPEDLDAIVSGNARRLLGI